MAEYLAVEAAELIERGLTFVELRGSQPLCMREGITAFLKRDSQGISASALGLALVGRFGGPGAALESWRPFESQSRSARYEAAARLLGIPLPLVRLIELNHAGGAPAAEIAVNLRLGSLGLRTTPTARPARIRYVRVRAASQSADSFAEREQAACFVSAAT